MGACRDSDSVTGRPSSAVADILRDAEANGLDPKEQLDKACGQVLRDYYGKLFKELPERPGDDFDVKKVSSILRAVNRLGGKKQGAVSAMRERWEKQHRGLKWRDRPPEFRAALRLANEDMRARPFDY